MLVLRNLCLLLMSDRKQLIPLSNSVLVDGFVLLKHLLKVNELGFGS
jgi:hypothetical protein